jgi:hypothetical protein
VSGALSLSLREYDATVAEAYRRLFPDDPEKSPEFLEWRFRRNPHGPGKFSIACADDVPIGMIALLPTRLRNVGVETLGYQAIDTSVHESARGRGLFVKMGTQAQDPGTLGGDVLCYSTSPMTSWRRSTARPWLSPSKRAFRCSIPKS